MKSRRKVQEKRKIEIQDMSRKRGKIKMQNKVAGLVGKGGTGYFIVERLKLRSAGTCTFLSSIDIPLEACLIDWH